jgi:hypothetical protein
MLSYVKADMDLTQRLIAKINEGHEGEVTDATVPPTPANP